MEWKPISTAPKDGTPILVCMEGYDYGNGWGGMPTTVSWRCYHPNAKGKECWRDSAGHKFEDWTHWMLLPKGPKRTHKGGV